MYDAADTQGTTSKMLYTCPHCHGRFEFNTESLVRQIFCPLCGQGFDPVKLETMRYAEGTPPVPSPGAASETVEVVNKEERLRVGTRLGQYRIDEFIGRGGMGAVYRATQTSLDRAVALKVLPRHMAEDPEFVKRFHREAKALAELNHPNIVGIYDKGNEDGQYFFAMELVDGVSLRELIKSKRVPPEEALRLVPQLCEALEYAHARGVIHRDIKPENILVDRSGRVKIADFGLARIVRGDQGTTFGDLTRSDVMMGTVNYMAPEQRENARDVDHRADIYSLGVVIYELLTGELPIGRFAPPSKKVRIDVRVDEIVLQLLEKDPEARYQRASDVKTVFESMLTGPPAPACPIAPAAGAPTSTWLRGIPGSFLGLTGTLLVAIGIHYLGKTPYPVAGMAGVLFGMAALGGSFWVDHGRPRPGERVHPTETVGGLLMLGLAGIVMGGFTVEALVDQGTFHRFWEATSPWTYLVAAILAFAGFEGLSAHVKARSERGRVAGTVLNVANLVLLLAGFTLAHVAPSGAPEISFASMLAYPFVAAAVFGIGWRYARPASMPWARAVSGPSVGSNVVTAIGVLLLLGAAALALTQLLDEVVHPWPFAWGTGNVWERASQGTHEFVNGLSVEWWTSRHRSVYGTLAATCIGLIALSVRLRTRSGNALAWIGMASAVAMAVAGSMVVGFSAPEPRDWIARLVAALAVPASMAAFGGLWLVARRSEKGLYGAEREVDTSSDAWAVRVFQAGCVLWIAGAALTPMFEVGKPLFVLRIVLASLGAVTGALALSAFRRIGGAEDGRTGLRYAIAGGIAACVFPVVALTAGSGYWGTFSPSRHMETTFLSAWLFVAFALLDAVLRPSQRLGRYFGLGGSLERRAWIGSVLGAAAIGGLLIAFDYRAVNRGADILIAASPFVGAIAYVFLVAWGVPLAATRKADGGTECPILEKGVSIQASCPSGAGVSIGIGTDAPPIPSRPQTSTPPMPVVGPVTLGQPAVAVAGVPTKEEIQAQVREALAGIPSADEIRAQVRESLEASGIPVPPAVRSKKGGRTIRKMWREALGHAGGYAIAAGGFYAIGLWGWWLFFWGCCVGAHVLSTLARTVVDPPHRPAATPQGQKRRKELLGFLRHATWFAAIMTGFAYPDWQFPSWGWFWAIGLAFHALSTLLDVSFGKD